MLNMFMYMNMHVQLAKGSVPAPAGKHVTLHDLHAYIW
jgi:hypothetical protein